MRIEDQEISLCMIVKNEEKNVTDCLDSIRNYVDEIVIVDTGSEDKTKEIVSRYTDKICDFKWVDDFSAARNFALSKCTKPWIIWMDADDYIKNPDQIKSLQCLNFDAFNFNIIYGNDVFCHARMFRNFRGVHFAGRVHEYPVLGGLSLKLDTIIDVIHKTSKHCTENRTLRNLRILEQEVRDEPLNSRALFYQANALRELGQFEQAIEVYRKYLGLSTWQDERFMAQKYIGQIRLWQKQYKESIEELFKAIAIDERWAEAYYYIGENYFLLGQFEMCIRWMEFAASIPLPKSTMFKEMPVYRDLPYRYIFASYETRGNFEKAAEYCELALQKAPEDPWLKDRLKYFKEKNSASVINCYRQGALGDCLMTTAALRGLKEKYPGAKIRYITHQNSIPILKGNKYIDELVTGNPVINASEKHVYFCYPDKDSTLKDEGYPDKPLSRHIVKIFNDCARLPDNSLDLECTLTEDEDKYGRDMKDLQYVSLHVQAGWSSYKEWGDENWGQVVEELIGMGYLTIQIGPSPGRRIKNSMDLLGLPIKNSISIIKHAVLHIGVDSFSNHAAYAVGTPAVILFGSTSPTGSGYDKNVNIWKGLDCSPCYREYSWAKDSKGPCPYEHRCMKEISVEEVMAAIKQRLLSFSH